MGIWRWWHQKRQIPEENLQPEQPKKPQKAKIQGYNSPKKKQGNERENLPKKISQKAKNKTKIKDKITQKSLQQLGTGTHPKGREEGFLRAKNSQKSEIRVKKMEGMIILLRKRQLIYYYPAIRQRNSPKKEEEKAS